MIALTRDEAKPFTDKQIELAVPFAIEASIAIENVTAVRGGQDAH